MSRKISSTVASFILSWNLRNLPSLQSIISPEAFRITATHPGKFPVDAWKPYFLEIPKHGSKKNTAGRGLRVFNIGMESTGWDHRRIITIPRYILNQHADIENLKTVLKHWDDAFISDDIPCLALAVKTVGYYSEGREAQSVSVLSMWKDAIGRIVSLDWAEGPLEDCPTPEWYVEGTPLLNIDCAIGKMQKNYEIVPSWEESVFSVYVIPNCLGDRLQGKKNSTSYEQWETEWIYDKHADLRRDLNILLSEIQKTFFEKSWDGEKAYE